MICVSVWDLIPESITTFSSVYFPFPSIVIMAIFLVVGVLASILIDKFFPSEVENEKGLYHVGILMMIAIIMHNIPEGIATFLTANQNTQLGLSLGLAIMLHNIPEGLSIAIPIYYATGNKQKALFYTLVSGLSEPLGAFIASFFLKDLNSPIFMGAIYAIIAGIMLHISSYELLPNSLKYKQKRKTILSFIIGFAIMIVSMMLIHGI